MQYTPTASPFHLLQDKAIQVDLSDELGACFPDSNLLRYPMIKQTIRKCEFQPFLPFLVPQMLVFDKSNEWSPKALS